MSGTCHVGLQLILFLRTQQLRDRGRQYGPKISLPKMGQTELRRRRQFASSFSTTIGVSDITAVGITGM